MFLTCGVAAAQEYIVVQPSYPTVSYPTVVSTSLVNDLRRSEIGFVKPSPEVINTTILDLIGNLKLCVKEVEKRSDGATFDEELGISNLLELIDEKREYTHADLQSVHASLLRDKDGLENPIFVTLRASIVNVLANWRATYLENPLVAHRETLERLYSAVTALAANANLSGQSRKDSETKLRQAVSWLQDHNQERDLIKLLKQRLSTPNQKFMVSEQFLNGLIKMTIADSIPLNTERDGTKINGNASISGITSLDVVQNDSQAKIQLSFDGNGPVAMSGQRKRTVFSGSGTIDIGVMQAVYLSRDHANQKNQVNLGEFAVTNADIDARIQSAGVVRNRALLPRNRGRVRNAPMRAQIAEKEMQKRDEETDAEIAAKITEMRQQVPDKAIDFGGEMKKVVEKFVWTPLRRKDLYPEAMRIFSSNEQIIRAISISTASQLAALTRPNPVANEIASDFVVQIHESVINNLSGMFAGELFSDDELTKFFDEVLGATVERDETEENTEGNSSVDFLFSRTEPISAEFRQNDAVISLRFHGFEVDGVAFTEREFRLRATYVGKPLERGLRFERVGDVRVEPIDGEAAGEDYETLRKIAGRVFFKSAQTDGLEIDLKMLPQIAGIAATSVQFQDTGWLVILMKAIPGKAIDNKPKTLEDLKKLKDFKPN